MQEMDSRKLGNQPPEYTSGPLVMQPTSFTSGPPVMQPTSFTSGPPVMQPTSFTSGPPVMQPTAYFAGPPIMQPTAYSAGPPIMQPTAYSAGPPIMQPASYPSYYSPGPNSSVQETLICQPTTTSVMVPYGQVASTQRTYNDYLCWSIMNTLCCFWPLGVAAIVFSCKTRSNNDARNSEAAARSSSTAFTLNIMALIIGIILEVGVAFYYFKTNGGE
ncbi:uncharacterized protein [Eleutherodactylus coqui]|uniref:uncharacterized protein n=1 Tax=Eleutherodactylus coqui TaxID=57060 RepID=UPI0034624FF9